MAADCGWMPVQTALQSALRCQFQRAPSMADSIYLALIDDDEAVLDALRRYLVRQDIRTSCFKSAKDFLAAVERKEPFDCIVSDVRMPGMSGLDLVQILNKRSYSRPIILITGHGDIDMAVAAIKGGAFDFIEKPFDEARLAASIRRAVEDRREGEIAAA